MFKSKLSEFTDKLVLLFAMLLFLWVGLSAIKEAENIDALSGQDRPLLSELKLNATVVEAKAPEIERHSWNPPESQSRGDKWIFDTFTPPVIYYDPTSQEFAVTPPDLSVESVDDSLWASFEIELLEVRLRPYRLQLVGYVGDQGEYTVYLENVATGELIALREGERASDLEARLISFQEQRVEVKPEDSMTVLQRVGVARLFDLRTNSEISLTNMETKMFSDLEAKVKDLSEGIVHVVKTGSRLESDTGEYIIGDLSTQPEEALVTKISKDGSRRLSKTLTPKEKSELKPQGKKRQAADSPFAIQPTKTRKKPNS